ncbi:IS3 family transposase [Paenibacillus validus]|uniref:IS3 family transposase n=1 Tax=Paenibacillus TaxID=44249 RepID=UPI0013DFA4D4|nr:MULTISPECIES: IS3 family transposase [Paenibacillus]MED4600046.1 IS3 family transposase [Paenibacillus validus]MED4605687.1 IS3 family transposase [Paenibacillus validus]
MKVLRIVGVARSTYYYQTSYKTAEKRVSEGRPIPGYSYTKQGTPVPDEQIQAWLLQFIENEGASYGYLKLTILLRRYYHLIINKKKVYRLCKAMKVLRPQRVKKIHYPKRLAQNRTVTASNQLWEADLKYGFITGEQRFFFILSIIDVYDRSIIDYHIGLRCEGKDAVQTLKQALWKRKHYATDQKPVIRTDNGPQFTSYAFQRACEELGIEHERIPNRTPNMNAHIEAFHRILQDECLSKHEFETYAEAYEEVAKFIRFYNETRIHSGIHFLSPHEFYKRKELIIPSIHL